MRTQTLAALMFLAAGMTCQAGIVTYDFSGTIGDSDIAAISTGDTFSGSFSYNTETTSVRVVFRPGQLQRLPAVYLHDRFVQFQLGERGCGSRQRCAGGRVQRHRLLRLARNGGFRFRPVRTAGRPRD